MFLSNIDSQNRIEIIIEYYCKPFTRTRDSATIAVISVEIVRQLLLRCSSPCGTLECRSEIWSLDINLRTLILSDWLQLLPFNLDALDSRFSTVSLQLHWKDPSVGDNFRHSDSSKELRSITQTQRWAVMKAAADWIFRQLQDQHFDSPLLLFIGCLLQLDRWIFYAMFCDNVTQEASRHFSKLCF